MKIAELSRWLALGALMAPIVAWAQAGGLPLCAMVRAHTESSISFPKTAPSRKSGKNLIR